MKVYLLSLNPEASARNQWDFGLLKSFLDDLGYDYSRDYTSLAGETEGGIVVIPARHHVGLEDNVTRELNHLPWAKLFLLGDEEGDFNVAAVSHPNIDITVQNPNPEQHDDYKRMGTGIPKHFYDSKPKDLPTKDLDYFFAGQSTFHAPNLSPPMNVNHRRRLMAEQLENSDLNGELIRSEGFTQGIEPVEYYDLMSRARVAPAPSGPELPDTFRLFEALELGCVPIADETTHTMKGAKDFPDYWTWFFGGAPPFPVIKDYRKLNRVVSRCVGDYPDLNNKCQAWWYQQKWAIKEDISEQKITVVIPVSPIVSHPDTKILDETIASVRRHLGPVKIVVSFDGVRAEQESMRQNYNEHIRAVLYKHHDIYPVIFGEHRHQSGMMRSVLESHITTPFLMYVEQDTPLEDRDIDFDAVLEKLGSGASNLVRFHHESSIPKEHGHMMLNKDGLFQETVQWSQRPHVASTAFYRRVMREFSEQSNCFIEDLMHGVVHNSFLRDGRMGYNQWRLHIYHPDGDIRRSYHTDGRQGEEKWDDKQIW